MLQLCTVHVADAELAPQGILLRAQVLQCSIALAQPFLPLLKACACSAMLCLNLGLLGLHAPHFLLHLCMLPQLSQHAGSQLREGLAAALLVDQHVRCVRPSPVAALPAAASSMLLDQTMPAELSGLRA